MDVNEDTVEYVSTDGGTFGVLNPAIVSPITLLLNEPVILIVLLI